MSVGDRVAILALGAALLIPALSAIWRGASFRSDALNGWQARIELARSGLREHAVVELRSINAITTGFLVGLEGANFDPLQVVADPAELSVPVSAFLNLLRVGERLEQRFNRFLKIGGLLVAGGIIYILGDAGVDLHFAKVYDDSLAYVFSWVLGALGAAAMSSALSFFIYYNRRLSSALMLSR